MAERLCSGFISRVRKNNRGSTPLITTKNLRSLSLVAEHEFYKFALAADYRTAKVRFLQGVPFVAHNLPFMV